MPNAIESILNTTLENIRTLIDVNTICGDPIHTAEGNVILPVSKVSFGFVAGGGEYAGETRVSDKSFAGGTGAGVTVAPVAFLVAGKDTVRVIPAVSEDVQHRLVDIIPQLVVEGLSFVKAKMKKGKEEDCDCQG